MSSMADVTANPWLATLTCSVYGHEGLPVPGTLRYGASLEWQTPEGREDLAVVAAWVVLGEAFKVLTSSPGVLAPDVDDAVARAQRIVQAASDRHAGLN